MDARARQTGGRDQHTQEQQDNQWRRAELDSVPTRLCARIPRPWRGAILVTPSPLLLPPSTCLPVLVVLLRVPLRRLAAPWCVRRGIGCRYSAPSVAAWQRKIFDTVCCCSRCCCQSTVATAPAARRSVPVLAFGAAAAAVATGVAFAAQVAQPSVQCAAASSQKLPPEGIPGTNYERTFIAIKPDGVQRQLIGTIMGSKTSKCVARRCCRSLSPSCF